MTLADELRERIDRAGARSLDTPARQAEFREVLDGFTPTNFDLFPLPDECGVDPDGHRIRIKGALVDTGNAQVVGVLARQLILDAARANHEHLELQRPYRGLGLTPLLLEKSFELYERCEIVRIHVHAGLQTGRWYWARLGFDFESPADLAVVATWGTVALWSLGKEPLEADSPARRWALLGTASDPPETVSPMELNDAISQFVAAHMADPEQQGRYADLANLYTEHFDEDWLGPSRFERCAEQNGLAFDEPIPLGKAIMLTGPDWRGVFNLTSSSARAAFSEELNRTLKRLANRQTGG